MNKIANRQVICETLMEQVKEDKSIVALCSWYQWWYQLR